MLDAAKRKLNEILAEYRERIDELRAVTVENDLAETASQTEGRRDADIELMNSIGEKMEQVRRDMDTLEQVDPSIVHEQVQFGSLVKTDQRNFLIAASIEDFDADGTEYLGLSVRSPLYRTLSGHRKGDSVELNNTIYVIETVA